MDSQLFDLDTVQEGAHTWPSDTWLAKRLATTRKRTLKEQEDAYNEANKR